MSDEVAYPVPSDVMSAEAFRQLGHRAIDLAADYLATIRDRPVYRPMTEADRDGLLGETLPVEPSSAERILERFATEVLPHPMGNGHPRFFGWVNSPPEPIAILADLLAATMNPSIAGGDHAAVYVERAAVAWLMDLVGFPRDGSMGLLVSGGSMASLTALSAARHRAATRAGWNDRVNGICAATGGLTIYLSSEGHTTLRKAAHLLGLGDAAVRSVPTDGAFRMDVAVLDAMLAEDRAAGHRPMAVVASAGTVGSGAIDSFDVIADVCERHDVWMHIDGAYGALGILDPTRAPLYRGLDRADSVTLDPHKWMSVPVECGCVLVRDAGILRDTFSLVPPYLRTEEGRGIGGLPWYSEYGFQQTRGFRALKLWMVLQQLGRSGYARRITRHNDLARDLAGMIDAHPALERVAPVTLSIVCFRFVPKGVAGDEAVLEALNKRIMELAQSEGTVFLSQATLNGRFALRACLLHPETDEHDLEVLVETIVRLGQREARDGDVIH